VLQERRSRPARQLLVQDHAADEVHDNAQEIGVHFIVLADVVCPIAASGWRELTRERRLRAHLAAAEGGTRPRGAQRPVRTRAALSLLLGSVFTAVLAPPPACDTLQSSTR
jgi:hypothetical protein